MEGSAPRIGGAVGLGVPVVVGGVLRRGTPAWSSRRRSVTASTVARSAAGRARIGRTFVRRKWSGHDVPSAASRGCSARARKSSTVGVVGEVPDLRSIGRREPAHDRQQGRGALPPLRLGQRPRSPRAAARTDRARPRSAMNRSAVPMISSELASHASRRLAPRGDPVAAEDAADRRRVGLAGSPRCRGRAGTRAAASGTQATRSPNASRVSASPSAAVASAIPESGWRWSTWAASTRPCIAVSIDGAAPPRPWRQ